MVITIIMNTRSQTANMAQEAPPYGHIYHKLFSELLDIEGDIELKNWLRAINRLQRAKLTLSQLPVTDRLGVMQGRIQDLMAECIRDAPSSVLEQPIFEWKEFQDGKLHRVLMVPFNVVDSTFDPLCKCDPRAQDHWCTDCPVIEDTVKYTLGALVAHNARQ